ncbi:hypothetical protein [Streptomyces sp. DvalAA-14]|uniref:hypothetical protein n=1 Tax=Streptomyces sp. DvalAA-14 TaxID=1839759 RepID=UPI00351E91F4
MREWPFGEFRLACLSPPDVDGFHLEILGSPAPFPRRGHRRGGGEPAVRRLPARLPAGGQRRRRPRRAEPARRPGRR